MTNILKFIFLPILLIFGAVWAVIVTFYLTLIFGFMWFFGLPIKIKEGGEETGHIRWFRFYPKLDK